MKAEFDFRMSRPEEALGRYVSGVWHARGQIPHQRERILPSASAVLLLVLGAPLRMTEPGDGAISRHVTGAWITGPHERPILNEPLGETHVVGAVFEPGGIAAFLEGPVEAIANRIVPLGDLASSLGSGAELLEVVEPCRGSESAIETLGRELAARLMPPGDYERWRGAVEALVSPDVQTVAEVQRAVGTSRRHFAAQMRRRVGLNPKSLQRIARWRRLLEDLDARRPIQWSSEAVGAGYFDQPHAIRDFREFAGMTPVEYISRRRQAWGHEIEPGEAANFVPEIIR